MDDGEMIAPPLKSMKNLRFEPRHSGFLFVFTSLIVSLLLLLGAPFADAQGSDFSPLKEDSGALLRLLGACQRTYEEELDQIPSKNRKDFLEVYNERWENVKAKFDKQEIYTSVVAQEYLDALVAEITKANPVLRGHPFRCYFSRSGIPNASYIGEGVILFNMGLFQRLDNESEAAWVLCHEISHFLLRHQENGIAKYVATINSEEVQAELHKIKGSEYRKRERLQSLVKGMTFDSRRHSRDHEAQADSMGVELLRNTPYALSGALTALALLDKIDADSLNMAVCLPQLFNSKDYPFQKRWLAKEEGLLGGHAHIGKEGIEDSLKTHPDCLLRMRVLTPVINRIAATGSATFVVDEKRFAELQRIFRYEGIEYAYVSKAYSQSLFLTMDLLRKRPADAYLVAQVGRLLNELYLAQKAHMLSRVTDLPSPEYPANYNLLLQFIQNLYMEDLAAISFYYLDQYHPQLDHYSAFKNAYDQSVRSMKP
ncbi:MAG TPA: M48 family metalloprotease [Puia sp.]|jgi:Zn-dependent protease with chaperone function